MKSDFDNIELILGMPTLDSFHRCQEIDGSAQPSLPVILLYLGFEIGADAGYEKASVWFSRGEFSQVVEELPVVAMVPGMGGGASQ